MSRYMGTSVCQHQAAREWRLIHKRHTFSSRKLVCSARRLSCSEPQTTQLGVQVAKAQRQCL